MRDLRQGPLGTPTAQLTALGWILSGPAGYCKTEQRDASVLSCVPEHDVNSLLRKFWEDEEVSQASSLTEEEEQCERHFVATHSRSPQGRYVVRLPFKQGPPIDIGESLPIVTSLYSKMEKKLRLRSEVHDQYREFLKEYHSLEHMQRVDSSDKTEFAPVYIPHHPVLRESSCTTKLRVVFNASCKTTNQTSLNGHLLLGPKLQQDLPGILLRWRQWCYVYTADIAKMFCQILVHPLDADFQRILWRPTEDSPIERYRLLTVTYGLAPAPYLAMRVLKQLALDEGLNCPAAVPVLKESIYVDDALFGADDSESLAAIREQLVEIMKRGGFQLRKWASNSRELLRDIATNQPEVTDHLLVKDDTLKVLGISWLTNEDAFRFVVDLSAPRTPTKRSILSFVAKLYDPLGWAAPVVISAKIILQELWLLKSDWDMPLPADLCQRWHQYVVELESLNNVRIPRWTGRHRENLAVEIHGFADASSRAYAAVIYLRVLHSLTDFQVSLLIAKTKVAPLKTISIPRLELNAVVLLSRLIKWTLNALNLSSTPIYGWTDSTIALAWLRKHPSHWNTFVANRVSEVQTNLPSVCWNHVPSKDNPADCASRGLSAFTLQVHSLWWTGPTWLQKSSTSWPIHDVGSPFDPDSAQQIAAEKRKSVVLHAEGCEEWELLHRFSNWLQLLRVTAYVRRFVLRLKSKERHPSCSSLILNADEIRDAEIFWLTYVQRRSFAQEFKSLRDELPVRKSSPLRTLSPFIGRDSLLRLGGRLKNAALNYDEQHPILLPKHRISELLIARTHKVTLHGDVQLVLRTLRQRYWLLGGRATVKAHIRQCVTCTRHSARLSSQLMGDLPSSRVNPSPPFSHTGVDYAGPFNIIPYVGRGQKARKYYCALFICLVTKAIHLECVEDCSTNGFLAAFNRFASRRGLPRKMYSDNGTNFHGAHREMQRNLQSLLKEQHLRDALVNNGVDWHFIPAAAPHFGGLWEAGVKSLKTHLKRVAGARTLSLAEFATLLCQIEACLNSRPIAALSDDPSDLSALTPGHFLIGRSLIAVPEESVLPINSNRLSRWQHVRDIQKKIWTSWSRDYLHSLQQRRKWCKASLNIEIGELVLLKNPLLPPSKWELARILQIHPGSDGLVRVATLRTARSTFKRPITQLCRLPVKTETTEKHKGSVPHNSDNTNIL